MDTEGEQPAAATSISYIDRVVSAVENNGDGDATSLGIVDGGEDNLGADDEDGNGDTDSNWSDFDNEFEEEPSDDELEYDSDEDTDLQLLAGKYKQRSSGCSLSEESKELLLWRKDKEDSFSDWTIEVSVANRGGDIKSMYHVHRSALGVGPKKSEYCETLFKSGQFSESVDSTSEVKLPEDAATFFPDFLDYLYSHPSECACLINRENRRALQYLASYFLVPKLTEAIHDFVEEDMHNLEHMEVYLSEFGAAEDDESRKILSIAGRVCADMILSIELDSTLLTALSPAIVLHMLKTARTSKDITSLPPSKQHHICRLALDYIKHHLASLDAFYFHALTSEMYFPDDVNLAGDVAIDLLEIMKLTGWGIPMAYEKINLRENGMEGICTDLLRRYLANAELTISKIDTITQKMPERVLRVLLAEAMIAKKSPKPESINDVSCKIMTHFIDNPVGSIIKISIQSTDSINYIRYLVSRHLHIAIGFGLAVYHEGKKLERERLVSNCAISSTTVLEIYFCY